MDIKDLSKTQMILLVLLVCFVVSIATGIVTVSLMQQVPKSVPQTINRVIERTINNVTSTPISTKDDTTIIDDSNAVVEIYMSNDFQGVGKDEVALGTGVIISDIGLVLAENNILVSSSNTYQIMLEKDMYQAEILKKYSNGFTILKILPKGADVKEKEHTPNTEVPNSAVDIKP